MHTKKIKLIGRTVWPAWHLSQPFIVAPAYPGGGVVLYEIHFWIWTGIVYVNLNSSGAADLKMFL
jgi:hypothetical protein